MADLSYVASTNGTDSTLTVATIDAGVPAGTVSGHGQVIWYSSAVITGGGAPSHTTPSGWTLAGTTTYTGLSGLDGRLSCYLRIAGGSEATVTLTSGGNSAQQFIRQSFANPDPATFLDAVPVWSTSASGTSHAIPSITTTVPRAMLSAFLAATSAGITWTPPGGMTERVEANSSTAADEIVASAGATGTRTFTSSVSTAVAYGMVALRSEPLTISAQPADQTVNNGATANFSVTAAGGTAPLSYQWKFNGSNVGTNSSSYSRTAAYADQGGQVTVVVTDANSLTVTSNAATLRIAFNTTGTGPRAYPNLGGPIGAGPVESWLRGTDAGGAPSHATTGALAAQVSTLAGTAAHLTLHSTTGALATQAATLSGTATHFTLHATTGALSAQPSTISGAAQHQHATTGALSAQASTIAGAAAHLTLHTTTGAMSAQASAIAGSAAHQHATSGALSAQAATISGAADHTTAGASHATSGDLAAQAASLAGSATHLTLHGTSGALSSQAATIAGSAAHQHSATGALSAQASAIAGSAAHATLHTTSGALGAQASTITGAAAHEHAATGSLSASAASIAGSAVHTTVGVHIASGALEAQAAQIAGSALLVAVTPVASPGKDGASPYKKWRYYSDDQPDEEPQPRKPDPEPQPVVVSPAPPKPRAPVSAGELLRTVQAMAEQRRAITAELERQENAQRQAARTASKARASVEQAAAVVIAMAQAEAIEQEIEDDDQEAIALAVSLLDL